MILETENLSKSFNGISAIVDLDYQMKDHALECIIGPNGAGKTTFFNLLTGTMKPDQGKIIFNGEDITEHKLHEVAKKGLVRKYQSPRVYNGLSVQKNMKIAATSKSSSNIQERIEDTVEKIRLIDHLEENAGSLDHGRKQWLEIGMVLVNNPKLMLLDEPTAGMTNEETKETAELIKKINDTGQSILVIEHDMDFIRSLKSRITVLHQGQILAQGDIDTIEANKTVQEVYIGGES